jgi:hypothetical protein
MATTAGTLDLTNTVPARMASLGISNVELASRYASVSPTTLRRMLAGAPGMTEKLKQFDDVLSELEVLKQKCWPIPVDFNEVGLVKLTQQRFKYGQTVVSNIDEEIPATSGPRDAFAVLSGQRR